MKRKRSDGGIKPSPPPTPPFDLVLVKKESSERGKLARNVACKDGILFRIEQSMCCAWDTPDNENPHHYLERIDLKTGVRIKTRLPELPIRHHDCQYGIDLCEGKIYIHALNFNNEAIAVVDLKPPHTSHRLVLQYPKIDPPQTLMHYTQCRMRSHDEAQVCVLGPHSKPSNARDVSVQSFFGSDLYQFSHDVCAWTVNMDKTLVATFRGWTGLKRTITLSRFKLCEGFSPDNSNIIFTKDVTSESSSTCGICIDSRNGRIIVTDENNTLYFRVKQNNVIALCAGLHNRTGANSVLARTARRCPIFDVQTLRLILTLGGAKVF